MPASSPSSAGTARSILLVEEYAALAVALGAALKRFAPQHGIRVVNSLAEAELQVNADPPDLLVVDLNDAGAVEAFQRIKAAHGRLGIIIIATGIPRGISRNPLATSTFEFVSKPFDLAELGSAIEKLLSSRGVAAKPKAGHEISFVDVLSLLCLAAGSQVVRVEKNRRRKGEIHVSRGQITHAAVSAMTGDDALQEILSWPTPRYTIAGERPSATRTIQGNWHTVLADAVAVLEPEEEVPPGPTETAAAPQAPPPPVLRNGKKVVIVDDTDLLLVFVEEVLGTAIPDLRLSTAADGAGGVREVTRVLPDLVLLDYSLPDINGDEVCRQLLAEEKTAKIPVIMMSGHVPEMMAAAARLGNIVATLAKPFLSPALVRLVAATLENPPEVAPKPAAEAERPEPPSPAPDPQLSAPVPPPATSPPAQRRNGNGSGGGKPPASPAPPVPAPLPSPAKIAQAPPPPPILPLPPAVTPVPAVVPLPAAAPASARAPAGATVVARAPASASTAATPMPVSGWAPARVPSAQNNNVVVGIPLEVVSMQFSPALQMAALRARPCSMTVSVHMDPQALPGARLPEAGFQLTRVDVDARGQIQTLRLSPTVEQLTTLQPRHAVPIAGVTLLPSNGGRALQLTPAPVTPMQMQLLASFELAGVELSPTFGISSLVLKARRGKLRVSLQPEAANTGATFETAQVLLDRSARIAEILFEAVA